MGLNWTLGQTHVSGCSVGCVGQGAGGWRGDRPTAALATTVSGNMTAAHHQPLFSRQLVCVWRQYESGIYTFVCRRRPRPGHDLDNPEIMKRLISCTLEENYLLNTWNVAGDLERPFDQQWLSSVTEAWAGVKVANVRSQGTKRLSYQILILMQC